MSDKISKQEVIVTDIHMPFGSMVIFMVKWAIAAVPAFILLVIIGAVTWGIVLGTISSVVTPDKERKSLEGEASETVFVPSSSNNIHTEPWENEEGWTIQR